MIHATYGPPTHYQTLGVLPTASQEEIKRAYWRLAKKYHPDRNKKKGAEAKFKEINEAYQVLGDPGRRQIYDYDLAQSRKAGTSSAGPSAPPPPPHSSGGSSGAGAKATPPPPPPAPPSPPQRAYRYLFFLRGVFVGGGAVALGVVLVLSAYAGCRRSSAEPASSAPAPETFAGNVYAPPSPAPTAPAPAPSTPEPPPTTPEPTATPEPPATPAPTPTLEPTPPVPDPTPAPVHLCGEWHGTFEWYDTEIRFKMFLEQNGDEVSGTWTETTNRRIWRATIRGSVDGGTVTLAKRYVDRPGTIQFIALDASSGLMEGFWETGRQSGKWRALREREGIAPVDSWRNRQRRTEQWRRRVVRPATPE